MALIEGLKGRNMGSGAHAAPDIPLMRVLPKGASLSAKEGFS